MSSKRRLKELRGSSARRAIESCLRSIKVGMVSAMHIKNACRCEPCDEMLEFEKFMSHQDPIVRKVSLELVGKVAPEKLIEPALNSETLSELDEVLTAIEKVAYNEIEDLTSLLREDDTLRVERVFQAFVAVGRADLLFGLAVSGDDKTTQRVKRYLHEQGFIK